MSDVWCLVGTGNKGVFKQLPHSLALVKDLQNQSNHNSRAKVASAGLPVHSGLHTVWQAQHVLTCLLLMSDWLLHTLNALRNPGSKLLLDPYTPCPCSAVTAVVSAHSHAAVAAVE